MIDLTLLLISLVGLGIGTNIAVNSAIVISRYHNLSDLFIGTAIFAMGTDLPELIVSLNASFKNLIMHETSGLILGNSIGSCFANIGLTMGIAGLFGYLVMPRRYIYKHGGVALTGIIVLLLMGIDGQISRVDGFILAALFIAYLFILFEEESSLEKMKITKKYNVFKTWLLIILGLAIVIISSEIAVNSVVNLANIWRVEQSFIAIVILGLGTSLPELSLSIASLKKARYGMSVGTLVGSNIFNILVPIGIGAAIYPLEMQHSLLYFDIPALFFLTLIVLLFFIRKRGLQRREAFVLVVLYFTYIILKIMQF